MRKPRLLFLTPALLFAGLTAAQAQNAPVVQQAETGTLGTDWTSPIQAGVQYISVVPTATIAAQNPGTAARVATYSVTFPGPGTYDLYARVRVGSAGANDDSFYYGNGFGLKSPTNDNDWITINQVAGVGYTTGSQVVDGAGSAQSNVWKWVNMSKIGGAETPISFTVTAGNLTQIFQLGAREDGFDIDKVVFGQTGLYFTVTNLDNGQQGSVNPPPPPFTPVGPPLATGKPKFLGGVYSTPQLPNFTAYWNQVVPENAGKWGSVEGTRDVMNWTELDAAYKLAKDNGYPFRMHVLVWGSQQPTWMETLSAAEQLTEINQWFAAVAQRYPAIDFLEVVNEPTHQPPNTTGGGGNYLNALGGSGATGWDWIIKSFQLARQYFPVSTKLMMNDYSVENTSASAQRYLDIVNLLKARNLLDVVGIQGHAFSTRPTPAATLTANLNLLASAGLPLYITELDIDGVNTAGQLDDQVQLAEYQRVFPVFWEHPAVKGVTMWGYRPGHWRTAQGAQLVNDDNTERTALVWLRSYVRTTTLATTPADNSAVSLYPNPVTNGYFTLRGTENVHTIRVVDMRGQLLREIAPRNQSSVAIKLNLRPGLYIVQLLSGTTISSKKLTIQ
ncbi:T9SS type A sorting domain-containing protein [Hymenobacter aquaticus]|uniref:T9SS type A sorting domain-containing protein n=1 Tax=Hymenobacter aquaticus TaxID=1867101 RepID=A0A4Z0Q1G9_9BACT|nr:endo-1,4-beta-xylanase [Hymenobacter aquaticus]TGE23898.1 T9SS type A sorting domain-containing protein [Hymenobacter aquaticus]